MGDGEREWRGLAVGSRSPALETMTTSQPRILAGTNAMDL